MEDKALISYKLYIKECDTHHCGEFSTFGICYIDDCLACPKTRVKIIREDGAVMRDDFKAKKNTMIDDRLWSFKRIIERDGVEIFEKIYNVKFTKFQKWYLRNLFKIKSLKSKIKDSMSLKFKANRAGDIAIISGIIVFGICMFSMVIDIPFGEFIVAFCMLLYSEMRHKYMEIRKQEIDEKLLRQKGENNNE